MPKYKLQRKYTAAWALWALGFIVIETFALRSKAKGDTLSEHIGAFERWAGSAGKFAVGGTLLWLLYHLLLEMA